MSIKILFFDVSMDIIIPCFRVSVTIEPGRSLLTICYHELFEIAVARNYSLFLIAENFIQKYQ